jgi:hypothetical protein
VVVPVVVGGVVPVVVGGVPVVVGVVPVELVVVGVVPVELGGVDESEPPVGGAPEPPSPLGEQPPNSMSPVTSTIAAVDLTLLIVAAFCQFACLSVLIMLGIRSPPGFWTCAEAVTAELARGAR